MGGGGGGVIIASVLLECPRVSATHACTTVVKSRYFSLKVKVATPDLINLTMEMGDLLSSTGHFLASL